MHFFFEAQLEDDGPSTALAVVSQYSPPDATLLATSEGTLFSCTHHGSAAALTVIKVVDIRQVVAMIPHKLNEQPRYFMFEQPGGRDKLGRISYSPG